MRFELTYSRKEVRSRSPPVFRTAEQRLSTEGLLFHGLAVPTMQYVKATTSRRSRLQTHTVANDGAAAPTETLPPVSRDDHPPGEKETEFGHRVHGRHAEKRANVDAGVPVGLYFSDGGRIRRWDHTAPRARTADPRKALEVYRRMQACMPRGSTFIYVCESRAFEELRLRNEAPSRRCVLRSSRSTFWGPSIGSDGCEESSATAEVQV